MGIDNEEYKKAKMAWEQEPEGGSYDIVMPDSEEELRMYEANLRLRPKLYEQNPELKAMVESRIQAIRQKLYGIDSNYNGKSDVNIRQNG